MDEDLTGLRDQVGVAETTDIDLVDHLRKDIDTEVVADHAEQLLRLVIDRR